MEESEESKDREYYTDLEIDEYNLIEEWQTQPGLYLSYASESADIQWKVDDLKDKIDVKQAKIALDIRNGTYPLMGNMKITEKAVEALVTADPDIIKLKQQYNEAKKEATLYKKIETAFDQRKKALENMVVLTGREQYATPKDNTNTMNEAKENKIKESLNKR